MKMRMSATVWLREQGDKRLLSNIADKLIFISGKEKQIKYYRKFKFQATYCVIFYLNLPEVSHRIET